MRFRLGTMASRCHSPNSNSAGYRNTWALYEFFLTQGTGELRAFALRLALHQIPEGKLFQLKLRRKKIPYGTALHPNQLALGYLVDILVSVGITPKDIAVGNTSLR